MFFWGDWTFILLIPAFLLSLYAQWKTSSTFKRYSKVDSLRGLKAEEAAKQILNGAGIYDVRIEPVAGQLTDHYDPRDKVLRLSESVYESSSIAAIGVAAHESGHAIQHARSYTPLILRNKIVPVVNISSNLAIPLFIAGFFFAFKPLLQVGIVFFAGVVLFHLVTLPVEFDASARAIRILSDGYYLETSEVKGVRKVLTAAGMTYVAAALMSLLNLLRLLLLAQSRD